MKKIWMSSELVRLKMNVKIIVINVVSETIQNVIY